MYLPRGPMAADPSRLLGRDDRQGARSPYFLAERLRRRDCALTLPRVRDAAAADLTRPFCLPRPRPSAPNRTRPTLSNA